jgi:Xaa-Pro aminopeptidase
MTGRLERLRAAMAEERLDALYISGPVDDVYGRHSMNRYYVSGFTGSSGVALITRERAILAVDFRYVEQAEREAVPRGFEIFHAKGRQLAWLPELVKYADLPGKRIGVSTADLSYAGFLALEKAVRELPWGLRPEVGAASPIVERLRRQKDADELALLQRAIDIADRAFERVEASIAPGVTEREVARRVERAVQELGGDGISFETIVAGGAWAAQPHATPRDEPLAEHQPIIIDMGAIFGGYCSDLTRTTVAGRLAPELRAIYEVVFAAQQRAIEKVEPGMQAADAHELAHAVIREAGYGEQFGHGLGHGVGLEVHEAPYVGTTSEDVLEEGMVFTIEPGIYIPGLGGVRIEDVVVLEDGHARVLSHARKLTPAGV